MGSSATRYSLRLKFRVVINRSLHIYVEQTNALIGELEPKINTCSIKQLPEGSWWI